MIIKNFSFPVGSPTFIVNKTFTNELVETYANFLTSLDNENPGEVILLINSTGGSLHALKSMVDLMYSSPLVHITIGTGTVASSALLLLMAGDHRYAFDGTMFMSHQYSWEVSGKYHELHSARKAQDMCNEFILNHYRMHTNLPESTVRAKLLPAEDVWFDVNEALKYNIIDGIISPEIKPIGIKKRKELDLKTKKSNLKTAIDMLKEHGKYPMKGEL